MNVLIEFQKKKFFVRLKKKDANKSISFRKFNFHKKYKILVKNRLNELNFLRRIQNPLQTYHDIIKIKIDAEQL